MSETKEQTVQEKVEGLKQHLHSLGYVGGRAVDALDLINKSTFPATDAAKVVATTRWLEDVIKDVSGQVEKVKAQIDVLQPKTAPANVPAAPGTPPLEVVSPEAPVAPSPESVSAGQDQAAGEVTQAPASAEGDGPQEIGEASDTLK
jgi:hypothetical protein